MGGPGSGARPAESAPTKAGLMILAWARDQRPGAVTRLATEVGVSAATVSRWIAGTYEPTISQAQAIKRIVGVPLGAWSEPTA